MIGTAGVVGRAIHRAVFNARLAWKIGADWGSRFRIFQTAGAVTIKRACGHGKRIETSFRIRKNNAIFDCHITDGLDLAVLYDVLAQSEYKMVQTREPRVIVDLGSNIGASVFYFKAVFPNARIYAVEPDPNAFRILKRNVAGLDNVSCYNKAVTDRDGFIEFFVDEDSSMSSSVVRRRAGQRAVKVESVMLDGLIAALGIEDIDLLKFDIEGSEWPVFKAFNNWNRVHSLIGELHVDIMQTSKNEFLKLFSDYSLDLTRLELPEVERYVVRAWRKEASPASAGPLRAP